MKNTNASAALIEVSFHDQQNEAAWIHKNIEEIRIYFIGGIYEAVGLEQPDINDKPLLDKMYNDGLINDIC